MVARCSTSTCGARPPVGLRSRPFRRESCRRRSGCGERPATTRSSSAASRCHDPLYVVRLVVGGDHDPDRGSHSRERSREQAEGRGRPVSAPARRFARSSSRPGGRDRAFHAHVARDAHHGCGAVPMERGARTTQPAGRLRHLRDPLDPGATGAAPEHGAPSPSASGDRPSRRYSRSRVARSTVLLARWRERPAASGDRAGRRAASSAVIRKLVDAGPGSLRARRGTGRERRDQPNAGVHALRSGRRCTAPGDRVDLRRRPRAVHAAGPRRPASAVHVPATFFEVGIEERYFSASAIPPRSRGTVT